MCLYKYYFDFKARKHERPSTQLHQHSARKKLTLAEDKGYNVTSVQKYRQEEFISFYVLSTIHILLYLIIPNLFYKFLVSALCNLFCFRWTMLIKSKYHTLFAVLFSYNNIILTII
jgi:hypothetical protein